MDKKIKLKIDKNGICEEFKFNGMPFGENVSKLEIIVEPGEGTKLIMTYFGELDIEADVIEIKKSKSAKIYLTN